MSLSYKITLWLISTVFVFSNCSNTKNTASRRAFHNVTARYNVVFEAQQSYLRGISNIENNVKPDYTELLPVFKIDSEDAVTLASADMDACIEECGKNILKHSITSKPKRRYSLQGMNSSQQAFYNKSEYCKWIDDTYLLMGKANYVNKDYDKAESSFQLGITRFKHEPSRFEAQFYLAKTFWAQKNFNEALEMLEKLEKDKRHPKKLDIDIRKLYADLAISTHKYKEAALELEKTISMLKRKDKPQRAWLSFICGDLWRMAGDYPEAKKCYQNVIKLNPKYSLVFNAKINLATVFTSSDDEDYIRKQLLELSKDEKNKEYYDRIYYGLAELDKKKQDFNSALINYRKSARYSFSNNVQKAKSYMEAANIYFDENNYIKAGEFYDSTMQFLPTSYSGYKEISKKASALTELITYIREAEYQDSLQRVAKMDLPSRQKLIAKIIDDKIAAEEAAKIAATNPYYQSSDNNYGVEYTGQDGNPNFQGKWYLYNVTALNYGRQEFVKKWGNRPLEDNWRRKNKSVSTEDDDEDSQKKENEEENNENSDRNPEFYVKNLPLTDSAMQASINKEAQARFNSADVYKDKIGDLDKAIETLLNLNEKHPNHFLKAQAYYSLYDLYVKKTENGLAEYVKSQLVAEFPESGYTKILNDPNYFKNLTEKKNEALDFYQQMLEDFNSGNYSLAIEKCKKAEKDFAGMDIQENFIYLEARCYGRMSQIDKMKEKLEYLIKNYPYSKLKNYALEKLKALEETPIGLQNKFSKDFLGKQHYFVVAADKSDDKFKELNFKILDFCANNGYSQVDLSDKDFSEKYKLYMIKDFLSEKDAGEFLSKYLKNNEKNNNNKIFIISKDNFEVINQDIDIESYEVFYLNNYNN